MQVGQQIREYIFEEEIGVGGMGVVWRARHRTLSRTYAVKVMLEQLLLDLHPDRRERNQERFVQEALVQAHLTHPHIVPIHDFFNEQKQYFIVMPLIDGESLEARLERGPLLAEEAVRLSLEVLDALNYAHQQGVIHCDVKPPNILIDRQGQTHLTDFGIAVLMGARRKTSSGFAVGTPDYMSPEQIKRPKQVDHRTDVYSFGCVLYEMLTGRPPFLGEDEDSDSEYAIKEQHVHTPPTPPRQFNPALPAALEAVILRALAKDRDARFSGCGELAQELGQCLLQRPRRPPTLVEEPDRVVVTRGQAKYYAEDLGGGVSLEMLAIPGGAFLMGSPDGVGNKDERPQHRVALAPFYLGKYPVTQAQWKAVMGEKKWFGLTDNNPSHFKGDDLPVESVSWDDAQKFCEAISQRTGKQYRLPSEAEWEYACRAGSTGSWCFGDDENLLDQYAWYSKNSGITTHPVGQKKPNAWGLYDMHGNVWEWCKDQWHGNYEGAPADGMAWADISSTGSYRVFRGGGWADLAVDCRSAARTRDAPGDRDDYLGFRLVRT